MLFFLCQLACTFGVGAEGADYFLVYARTNHDPATHPHKALTCFIVERTPEVKVEMVPERLGTAAMTIGPVINQFQGVSFQVAEAAMLLDAARSLTYTTCRAVDEKIYE